MKNFLKKVGCIFMSCMMAGMMGCGPKMPEKPQEEEYRHRVQNVSEGTQYLVKDGQSDYSILIPENANSAETYAAGEFNALLQKATGVVLPIVQVADLGASTKYISLGNTAMKEAAGVEADLFDLTRDGFRIVSYGDGLVIAAPKNSGVLFGVYRFFEENFNYMYYSFDEVKIDTGDTFKLKKFDYEDWPDFQNRDVFGYETLVFTDHARRLYLNNYNVATNPMYGEGSWWSVLSDQSIVFEIVPWEKYHLTYPAWYTPGTIEGNIREAFPQLCYTKGLYDRDEFDKGDWDEENYADGRHGLFWTFVYNLINNYIAVETDKSLFQIGMSDNSVFCNCERCTRDVERYTRSGVALRFVNAVADEVEKWRLANCPERQIYVTMFAYISIVDPPVKEDGNGGYVPLDPSVVARDNVVIRYAPINEFYMFPLMDEENNPSSRRALLGWSVCAKHFAVWDYRVNFAEMIQPVPQWMSTYDNLKTYYDLGFVDIMNQGCRTFGGTPFLEMDNWVRARLEWDIHQDYDTLRDEFFDVYYKDASDAIFEYMQYVEQHSLNYMYPLGYKGHTATSVSTAKYYPRSFVLKCEEIFSRAYAAIEHYKTEDPELYEKLKLRVDTESIFYRYMQLSAYAHFYTSEEKRGMIDEFERICRDAGVLAMQTELIPISEMVAGFRAAL